MEAGLPPLLDICRRLALSPLRASPTDLLPSHVDADMASDGRRAARARQRPPVSLADSSRNQPVGLAFGGRRSPR
jgi:hypothetical protein